jgi:two-component system CheB/CheR fusion protein
LHEIAAGKTPKGAIAQYRLAVTTSFGSSRRQSPIVAEARQLWFRWMSDAKSKSSANDSPIVVAIGASAGGVQALQTLFETLPNGTGAAFVVIVHLDPQAHSDLASILASRTRMPVVQVQKSEELRPDHVYVIPPDRRLQITDHQISATEFDKPRGQRTAIDLFFRSLAEKIGDGFAVILTGAGSDGTIGVRAIKEAGGIVLVQDPDEAEHASMPRSAIATGVADFVLPLRELAARLVGLIDKKRRGAEAGDIDQELLGRIFSHVSVRTGHDFSKYRRSTVLRRIARRMQVTQSDDLRAYYQHLSANAGEAQALLNDLLISVTTFFRDAEVFDLLKAKLVPKLFESRDTSNAIRIWVPGCATGEEAYTIGILLLEEAARHEDHAPMQVFGSDLDSRALAIARSGRYPIAIEADVSEERLRRFFARDADHYRVRQDLRDMVLFANHSLLKDPPFSRIDLVSCRNLLIYLDHEVQEQVVNTIYYALNPGGYLLLGPSESADRPSGLFRTIDHKARLYQSTAKASDKARVLPTLVGKGLVKEPFTPRPLTPGAAMSEVLSHRRALEQAAPPSILVDESHHVLHLSENAGRYIHPIGGPLTGDVVDLVRPEFRADLRAALHRAFDQHHATLSLPILVSFNGAPHRVDLQVKPLLPEEGAERSALVLFIEGEAIDPSLVSRDRQAVTNETVRRLAEELELTQARMRTLREESAAANEELRASNEELQSMNEEYRSTSEELETSKEELQSMNEELTTVNNELKQRLEAVSRANSDLQNLMAVTEVGALFLDTGLRIRRFTSQVTQLFSITPIDEGRPITDFTQALEYTDLAKDARAVLDNLTPTHREVHSRNNGWFDVRLRAYRTVEDKIDGVVITFLDVTGRHKMEEALRDCEKKLELSQSSRNANSKCASDRA